MIKKHKNTNAQYANKHKRQKGYSLSLPFAAKVKEQKSDWFQHTNQGTNMRKQTNREAQTWL